MHALHHRIAAAAAAAARTTRVVVAAAAAAASTAPAEFSGEQQGVIDRLVKQRQSLFVTGKAGTGKSHTLAGVRRAATVARMCVGTTAMTGIAGQQIGGVTLNSFLWLGLGTDSVEVLARKMRANPNCRDTDLLIIDEIGMCSAELFEKVDEALRIVRNRRGVPFGGMVILAFGDFAQLPPVFSGGKPDKRLVFESAVWQQMFPPANCVRLTKVFRQTDATFVQLLDDVRVGRLPPTSRAIVDACARELPVVHGIEPTVLHATRADVDETNQTHLDALAGEAAVFEAEDYAASATAKLDTMFQARRRLELKVGAQVMLIKNKPEFDLANGSRARVLAINEAGKTATVVFVNGVVLTLGYDTFDVKNARGVLVASRRQMPFILAWAVTIHKSQGQTLDRVTMDLSKCFEFGHAYVAISRARSLDSLCIVGLATHAVKCDPRVLKYMAESGEVVPAAEPAAAASSSSSAPMSSAAAAAAAATAAYAAARAPKRKAPDTDTDVLAWYAAQNKTTIEEVRALASKRTRTE